jgi:hypothetical protein
VAQQQILLQDMSISDVKSVHIFTVMTATIYFQDFIFSIICQLDVLVLYALY